jgi:hypothetical protein
MRHFTYIRAIVLAVSTILLTGLTGCERDPGPTVWKGVKNPNAATALVKEAGK